MLLHYLFKTLFSVLVSTNTQAFLMFIIFYHMPAVINWTDNYIPMAMMMTIMMSSKFEWINSSYIIYGITFTECVCVCVFHNKLETCNTKWLIDWNSICIERNQWRKFIRKNHRFTRITSTMSLNSPLIFLHYRASWCTLH